MAGAAALRLRSALEEFISSQSGDAGQMRSAQTGGETVQLAQQLLDKLGAGEQDQATPGQRARARATGGGNIANAAAKAREMLGGR